MLLKSKCLPKQRVKSFLMQFESIFLFIKQRTIIDYNFSSLLAAGAKVRFSVFVFVFKGPQAASWFACSKSTNAEALAETTKALEKQTNNT